jgi:hypothetical protein
LDGAVVTTEHTFWCNGPDCDRHVKSMKVRPPVFLSVSDPSDERGDLHFCGWDCALRFAGQKEPETLITLDDEGESV